MPTISQLTWLPDDRRCKGRGLCTLNAALSVPGQYHMAASYSCGSLTDETFDPEMDKQLDNAFGTTDLRTLNGTDKDLKMLIQTAKDLLIWPFL